MEIKRIDENEWEQFRDLRLRALAEDPSAFGSLLKEERVWSEKRWREIARGQVFAAIDAGRWIGMSGCFPGADGVAIVWGMWVHPSARGKGIGKQLLHAAIECAREQNYKRIRLSVTESNAAAEALYRSFGFQDTGKRKRLRSNPELTEAELELPL